MVNFTGIKNVSYTETGSVRGGKNPKGKPLSHTQYMNFELTNDNNDDLDQFVSLIPTDKECNEKEINENEISENVNSDLVHHILSIPPAEKENEYINPINPGVVGLQISGNNIYLNDKKLKLKNENIPLIQFITDIVKRIAASDKKFDLDQDYMTNEALQITPLFRETRKLEEFVQCPWPDEFVSNAHYPFVYQDGAQKIVNSVTDIMTGYFDR